MTQIGEGCTAPANGSQTVREEAARPRLTIHRPFRAIGGKKCAPGTYRITQVEVDGLRLWQARMEAQANQHDWDAPSGFSPNSWPPFTLQRPTQVSQ